LYPVAKVYERFLDDPGSVNPEGRRPSLAFAAAAEGLTDLARRLADPPGQPPLPWQPVWRAKWHSPASPGNPDHRTVDPVRTVIAADFTGGPAVVAGTKTGMAVSWDLETGKVLHHWSLGTPPEWDLTELRIGSQVAVLVSNGNQRICLDPVSGDSFPGAPEEYFNVKQPHTLLADLEAVDIPPRQHAPKVPATFSVVDRRIVLIEPSSGHALAVRNLLDGSLVGELADERSGSADTLASCVLGTRPVVLSGSKDGKLAMWDLKTGKLTETVDLGQPIEMIVPAPHGFLVVVIGGDVLVLRRAADPADSRS
jgi:WD40 repeat protein